MILRIACGTYLQKTLLMSASCKLSSFERLFIVNNAATAPASVISRLPIVRCAFPCPKISKHCHSCGALPVQKTEAANNISAMLPYGVSVTRQPETSANARPSDDKHYKDADTIKSRRLKRLLEREGIFLENFAIGTFNGRICPTCKGGSKMEKSLRVTITDNWNNAYWTCYRGTCGWSSFIKYFKGRSEELTLESLRLEELCPELVEYLNERMISKETFLRNKVMQRSYDEQVVFAFTYWRDAELVGCKFRDAQKSFWKEGNTGFYFYGLNDINDVEDIIIVEGEIDKLSMEEAGFRNCVSVPNGAQFKDSDFQYMYKCSKYLEKASRIILATNGDAQGFALAEEIARRVGHTKCWHVKWPKKNETESFKDANDVLVFLGTEALKQAVENAEMFPVKGLFRFQDFNDEIDALYHQFNVDDIGVPTGWASLNQLYNVVPGEVTVITGVPNSGKSEWIDALMCNINSNYGWTFALGSFENRARDHARKLLEKHVKKPFFNYHNGQSVERMTPEEFEMGKEWLSHTFYRIGFEDDVLPNVKEVLRRAKLAVSRHGVKGLVIDPYSELDHDRSNMSETEYVSAALTEMKRFARQHLCHVWFVAHPKQLQDWRGGPPDMYDISGSAHFMNKCDNGIVIHRNVDPNAGPLDLVQVCVRKVRNKVAGTIGEAYLSYNRVTGEYYDVEAR